MEQNCELNPALRIAAEKFRTSRLFENSYRFPNLPDAALVEARDPMY
jgi:hypothetical protein